MTDRLYHVSEEADITAFEPRPIRPDHPTAGLGAPLAPGEAVVWAIGESRLHNYLVPRDCPRVAYYARPDSDPADVARLLRTTAAHTVIAIESGWLDALRTTVLWLYELPADPFELIDPIAAHYVSRRAVRPLAVRRVDDLLGELADRGVEVRLTPSLWPLRDAVVASSLGFSCIRLANARPQI